MFSVGNYVSYRSDGVCKIIDIRKESFGALGKDILYYILSPINDEKSTFFVPTDNALLVSMMRKLLSSDEITELVKAVSKKEPVWIDDSKQRGVAFKEILSKGDREEMLLLIKAVNNYQKLREAEGKKVYSADLSARSRAAKLLLEEFSIVLPISSEDELLNMLS